MSAYNPQLDDDHNDQYIIFFTDGCENSYNFVQMIQNLQRKFNCCQNVQYIDIASNSYPSDLEYLPALVINGNFQNLYQGEEAFQWIEHYIKLKDIKGVDIKLTNFSYVEKEDKSTKFNDNLDNFEESAAAFVDPSRPSDLTQQELEQTYNQQMIYDQQNGTSMGNVSRADIHVLNHSGNVKKNQPFEEPHDLASSLIPAPNQQAQQQPHQHMYQERQQMQISQNSYPPQQHNYQNPYSRLIPPQPQQQYYQQQELSKQQRGLPQNLRSFKVGRPGSGVNQELPDALKPQKVGKMNSDADTRNHMKKLEEQRRKEQYTFRDDGFSNSPIYQQQYYPTANYQHQPDLIKMQYPQQVYNR